MAIKVYYRLSSGTDADYTLYATLGNSANTQTLSSLLPATDYTFKIVQDMPSGTPTVLTITATTDATGTVPLILNYNDFAGTILVSPASGSSDTVSDLRYSINGGSTQNVLPSTDTTGAIPVNNQELATGAVAVWSINNPTLKTYSAQAFHAQPVISPQTTNLVIVGDSLTYNHWYLGIDSELPLTVDVGGTLGYPGQTMAAHMVNATQLAAVDALLVSGKKNVLVQCFGRNDVSFLYNSMSVSDAVADQKANRQAYVAARKAAGWHQVVDWTVTPSQASGLIDIPANEVLRQAVNTQRRNEYLADGFSAIIDGGGDAKVGQFNSVLDSTLYDTSPTDKTHPTTLGNVYLRYQALPVLQTLPDVAGIGSTTGRPVIGDVIEDDDDRIIYSTGATTYFGSGYLDGKGKGFDTGETGTITLDFTGGGFEVPVIPGINVQQDYLIDGTPVTMRLIAGGTKLGCYGLVAGDHTLVIQNKTGAPGYTLVDQIKITDGVLLTSTAQPGIIYQDDHLVWEYSAYPNYNSHWGKVDNVIYNGGSLTTTNVAGATAILNFEGNAIEICVPPTVPCKQAIFIDDVQVGTQTAELANGVKIYKCPNSDASHTLKIIPVVGGTSGNTTGVIDYAKPLANLPADWYAPATGAKYDTKAQQWDLTGNWIFLNGNPTGYSNGDTFYTTNNADFAEFRFNGSSIDVGVPQDTTMDAYIDGVFVKSYTNSGTGENVFVNVAALSSGDHVLKIKGQVGTSGYFYADWARPLA